MKKLLLLLPVVTLCLYCVPVGQRGDNASVDKVLLYDNQVYEDNIKTVLLYPFQGNLEDEIKPSAISLEQDIPLLLAFDQLNTNYEEFKVKIIHCDRNWQKSLLQESEYLFSYNEFPVRDYEFSFNTRTPYTHYRFTVPKVKISGNYLLVVYRGSNPQDIMLSQRFMVFDQIVGIVPEVGLSSDISSRKENQQITFSINYSNIEILNPYEDIKVVIRQNERWDNAITTLKPTFVRETEKIMEYDHFDLTNNFAGGNEFRFFDIRTINYSGQNISGIKKSPGRIDAFVMKDEDRGDEVYGQFNDINGDFVINNLEASPPAIASDYVSVHFFLETDQKAPENVYLAGQLTNWQFNAGTQVEYDEALGGYAGTLLLKQGWYNYIYYVPEAENPYLFEGSHYETENQYEFIVYYRPPGTRADHIIGYLNYSYNDRR